METYKDAPLLTLTSIDQWTAWLDAHATDTPAVWLKLSKKGAAEPTITYEQARNIAIAYGWIDGLVNALDKTYYCQRFTPRRPKGLWSKINRGVVEELIATGQMRPAGQAQVDAAKADGRWDAAYDGPATVTLPEDFAQALKASPQAEAFFAALNKTNRYAFLWRIHTAPNPTSRAKRIAQYTAMLAANQTLHPKVK